MTIKMVSSYIYCYKCFVTTYVHIDIVSQPFRSCFSSSLPCCVMIMFPDFVMEVDSVENRNA